MVSITSSADLATRWAFPTGTWISAAGKKFHRYSDEACLQFGRQRSFYVRTPGHNKALISHEVTAKPLAAGDKPADLGTLRAGLVETEFDPVAGRYVFSFKGAKDRFTLRPLTGAANDSPYWIMGVPKQLIPGHSGFFTEDTLRLIGAIVRISGMPGWPGLGRRRITADLRRRRVEPDTRPSGLPPQIGGSDGQHRFRYQGHLGIRSGLQSFFESYAQGKRRIPDHGVTCRAPRRRSAVG
jgi:hypothetical protein